jgi:hypothetical protein
MSARLYADEYERIGGEWRISRSRREVVWPELKAGERKDT